MDEYHVVKVKHGSTLRRITFSGTAVPSFATLERKIFSLFQFPDSASLALTYVDNEGDLVTMVDNLDLKDALILQKLNPLRITVTMVENSSSLDRLSTSSLLAELLLGEDETLDDTDCHSPRGSLKSETSDQEDKIHEIEKKVLCHMEGLLKMQGQEDLSSCEALLGTISSKVAEVIHSAVESGVTVVFEPKFEIPGLPGVSVGDSQDSASSTVVSKPSFSSLGSEALHSRSAEFVKEKTLEGTEGKSFVSDGQSCNESPRVVHSGIECDVCKVNPIIGNRYKSTVKFNYDLCSTCYDKHGVEGEYNTIEKPLPRPGPRPLWNLNAKHIPKAGPDGGRGIWFGGHTPVTLSRPSGKLDMQFVKDVTVSDGTVLEPGNLFTKTWRLLNSGTLPWPKGTQLQHVGGSRLGSDLKVDLLFPDTVDVGQERDISLNFIAPNETGRYVSHWRLRSPSGEKFGNRIWALVEVATKAIDDATETGLVKESKLMKLNDVPAPSENLSRSASTVTQSLDLVSESHERPSEKFGNMSEVLQCTSLGKGDMQADSEDIVSVPTVEAESGVLDDVKTLEFQSVLEETGDNQSMVCVQQNSDSSSSLQTVAMDFEGFSLVERPSGVTFDSAETMDDSVKIEEAMVREMLAYLEAMGYMDSELNSELLRKNNFMLQPTISDLGKLAEWDPLIEELSMMGFPDARMNRDLMFKKDGVVKHVVKELVNIYR